MTKFILQPEVPKRKQKCFVGQEAFEAGMEYYSQLSEGENGKLNRQDFCLSCWEQWKQQGSDQHESYWRSKVLEEKKRAPIDRNERALDLLKEALQKDDKEEAFILALYLSRNRRLAMRSQDERWVIYEILDTEEMLAVPKIELSALQIEKVKGSLVPKLGS